MMKKIALLLGLILLVGISIYFDLGRYLTLEFIKTQQSEFQEFYGQQPVLTMGIYFVSYVLVAALSIPGAAVLTLLGGALFGLWIGLFLVSFASSVGATLSFLAARYLLRDFIQQKFRDRLKPINQGIEQDGAFYLFSLRLVPIFPFFAVNLVMGLTPIRVWTFYWVSQIGMLLGTLVYVQAGTQLSKLSSGSGILSWELMLSFVALGLFPILAKKALVWLKKRQTAS
jgi:uncharacterized membrane protein YdjX (TVP38/TMEM64 family)